MADLSGYTTEQLQAMLAQAPAADAAPPSDFAQRIIKLGEKSAPTAVSPKGAYSEAQVMPATVQSPGFGVKPADPSNLNDVAREGADYANAMLARYGDEHVAAAAYNAGPGVVDDWLNGTNNSGKNPQGLKLDKQNFASQIPFPETKAYVQRVAGTAPVAPATQSFSPITPAAAAEAPPGDLSKYTTEELQGMLAGQTQKPSAPVAAKPAPTPQTDQGLGFYQGLTHGVDRLAEGAKWVANQGAIPFLPQHSGDMIDKAGQFVGLSSTEDAANAHQNYIKGEEASGKKPGFAGELGGELLAAAPFAGFGPIAGGAAAGAELGDSTTPGGVTADAGLGGVFGKLGDVAMQTGSRILKPAIDKGVKLLADSGVHMTPGQILGSKQGSLVGRVAKRAEDAALSIPGLGDLINMGRNESVVDLNRAATNEALKPIGQTLPHGIAVGHESVKAAGDTLGHAYDTLLPKLSVAPDKQFVSDVANVSQDVANTLPRNRFAQFRNIIQNNPVLNRLSSAQAGPISGVAMKEADSALGRMARGYASSSSEEERQFGAALGKVQTALRSLTVRSNPTHAAELSSIDQGWAKLVPVETAAAKAGAAANKESAVFSPQQYQTAVRGMDNSVRDRATARGTQGDLQDLAEAGARILPSAIGDSGTASRLMIGRLLGGSAGIVEGTRGGKDLNNPYVAVPAALALGAYSPAGRHLLQKTLLHDPGPVVGSIADLLSRLGKLSGPALPAYFHANEAHNAPNQ